MPDSLAKLAGIAAAEQINKLLDRLAEHEADVETVARCVDKNRRSHYANVTDAEDKAARRLMGEK